MKQMAVLNAADDLPRSDTGGGHTLNPTQMKRSPQLTARSFGSRDRSLSGAQVAIPLIIGA